MDKFKNLKVSDKLSEQQFYSVVKISGDKVQLINERNENIIVDKNYVNNCLTSASDFTETKKITKTEAAELFLRSTGVVMTVNFSKQVKSEDVIAEVMAKISDAKVSEIEKAVKEGIKKAINGSPRDLVGFHYGNQDDFGRTHVIDLNLTKDTTKEYDSRSRLCDSRSLNWMIIRGVKYIVK